MRVGEMLGGNNAVLGINILKGEFHPIDDVPALEVVADESAIGSTVKGTLLHRGSGKQIIVVAR